MSGKNVVRMSETWAIDGKAVNMLAALTYGAPLTRAMLVDAAANDDRRLMSAALQIREATTLLSMGLIQLHECSHRRRGRRPKWIKIASRFSNLRVTLTIDWHCWHPTVTDIAFALASGPRSSHPTVWNELDILLVEPKSILSCRYRPIRAAG